MAIWVTVSRENLLEARKQVSRSSNDLNQQSGSRNKEKRSYREKYPGGRIRRIGDGVLGMRERVWYKMISRFLMWPLK